jgi:hypothetical protein
MVEKAYDENQHEETVWASEKGMVWVRCIRDQGTVYLGISEGFYPEESPELWIELTSLQVRKLAEELALYV